MHYELKGSKITGIFGVVPKGTHLLDEYVKDSIQKKKLETVVGLGKRRIASLDVTAYDLGYQAARRLIEIGSYQQVDAVIFVTQTPDHFQPGNACKLHKDLNLRKDVPCFDVNLGCSGWVYGLWLSHLIASQSKCNNVLLVAADTLSKCIDINDSQTNLLFGDAGSATMISKDIRTTAWFNLATDGNGRDKLKVQKGAFREAGEPHLFMDGIDVFRFTTSEAPKSIKDLIDKTDNEIEDIDYFVFHQANDFICSTIGKNIGLPMRSPKVVLGTLKKYGNLSSASIPVTIAEMPDVQARKTLQLLASGFGVGYSWANAIFSVENLVCAGVGEYES